MSASRQRAPWRWASRLTHPRWRKVLPVLLPLLFFLYMFERPLRWEFIRLRSAIASRVAHLPVAPSGRILDAAHVLDAASITELDELVRAVEHRTSAEIDVVTVPSLQGMVVEAYANRLFNTWKIGKRGKDNGVLLLIAPTERKMRIEVGYGLEGDLPDGLCGDIIRSTLVPAFKDGRFGPGTVAAVHQIGQVIGGLGVANRPVYTTAAARAGSDGIVDGAGILSPPTRNVTANEIGLLREREHITLRVETVASLAGRTIQEVATEHFGRWPLDRAVKDRAILLLVAPHEGAARIVLGGGLAPTLSQAQADRLATSLTRELAKGNIPGAFWSCTADLDRVIAGRLTLSGLPRTPDQLNRARTELERSGGLGLPLTTIILGLFVTVGAGIAASGAQSRTIITMVIGAIFCGFPFVAFVEEPVALGLWWPPTLMAAMGLIGALIGWRLGNLGGTMWRKGRSETGWSWGGGGGFGGSGGGSGGGGGSSGGGGASGGW